MFQQSAWRLLPLSALIVPLISVAFFTPAPAHASRCSALIRQFNSETEKYASIFNRWIELKLCSEEWSSMSEQMDANALKRATIMERIEQSGCRISGGSSSSKLRSSVASARATVAKMQRECAKLAAQNQKRRDEQKQAARNGSGSGNNCHWSSGISGGSGGAGRQWVCDGGGAPPNTASQRSAKKTSPPPTTSHPVDNADERLITAALNQIIQSRTGFPHDQPPGPAEQTASPRPAEQPASKPSKTISYTPLANARRWADQYDFAAQAAFNEMTCLGWKHAAHNLLTSAIYSEKASRIYDKEKGNSDDLRKAAWAKARAHKLLDAVEATSLAEKCLYQRHAPRYRARGAIRNSDESWRMKVKARRLAFLQQLHYGIKMRLDGEAQRRAQEIFDEFKAKIANAPIPPKNSGDEEQALNSLWKGMMHIGSGSTDMSTLNPH